MANLRKEIVRSWLFVPGNDPRKVRKAFECGADAVVLDLEDAIDDGAKSEARSMVIERISQPALVPTFVRVNGVRTAWCHEDIRGVVAPGLSGVMIPKVESIEDVLILDWLIQQVEREKCMQQGSTSLVPMIETSTGLAKALDIAAGSPRVTCLGFGVADYIMDMGIALDPDESQIAYARQAIVHATRAAKECEAIDGVVVNYLDNDAFRSSAQRARSLGYVGKYCIHPSQVSIANEIFTPSEREIEWAVTVLAAFEAGKREGSAALAVKGEFVDLPVAMRAQRIVDLAKQLSQQGPAKTVDK